MNADILMAIAGFVFSASIWFQVYATFKQKTLNDVSWTFLILAIFATILLILAKEALGCYLSVYIDTSYLIGCVVLSCQKLYYEKRPKCYGQIDAILERDRIQH